MAKEENLFEEKAKEEGGKPAANTDKLKALRAAMDKIEKNYGKGSITLILLASTNVLVLTAQKSLIRIWLALLRKLRLFSMI